MKNRSSNLELTRFVAAVLVIFHHSFVLVDGGFDHEWLWKATKGQLDFGAFAVAVFFLCGGYLAARDITTKKLSLRRYVLLRLERILPALMFVTILCTLAGAFVTELKVSEYFLNASTYKYFLNGFMLLQHELPGVFQNASYTSTVNGSLWTLPVEFACNVACCIGFQIKILSREHLKKTIPLVCAGALLGYFISGRMPVIRMVLRPCLLFYMGMLYWIYREKITLKTTYAYLAVVLLVFSSVAGILEPAIILLLPYIMITFWFGGRQYFGNFSKLGRYSYAMYLWGFPIQQLISELAGWKISSYRNAAISLPVTFVLAYVTFHLVEIPAKNKLKRLITI